MTRKNIRAVSRGHGEATVESLRKDPKFAVEYPNAVLQDGDEQDRHSRTACRGSTGVELRVRAFCVAGVGFINPQFTGLIRSRQHHFTQ